MAGEIRGPQTPQEIAEWIQYMRGAVSDTGFPAPVGDLPKMDSHDGSYVADPARPTRRIETISDDGTRKIITIEDRAASDDSL